MTDDLNLSTIIAISDDVIYREIEDEILIIPLVAGIADADELFSLNKTGQAIWNAVDGMRPVSEIIAQLKDDFEYENEDKFEQDVLGFVEVMLARGFMVVQGEPA